MAVRDRGQVIIRVDEALATSGIAQAGGEAAFGDAELRTLTNSVTSYGQYEMIGSDEEHQCRAGRRGRRVA